LFIFAKDNPITSSIVSLFQRPTVADEIRDSFVFLALDVTCSEGWQAAVELGFTSMPLIAMVRARGPSLASSTVFITYEGKVSETTLLASMRLENQARNPDTAIVQNQDEEYNQALAEHQENERGEQQAQEEFEVRRRDIDADFERIPIVSDQADAVTIRYQFPDGSSRTHTFPKGAELKWLFVFARKIMFPADVTLLTGFPPERIEECELPIGDIYHDKQFVVYVELNMA
jgi:hypothetical protein